MYRWPRPAAADAPTSRSYPLPPAPFPRPATLASEPLPGHAALAPELLLRPALLAPAREEPVVWTPPEEPRFAYPPLTFGGQMREDLSNGEQFVQDGCNGEIISALSLLCRCTDALSSIGREHFFSFTIHDRREKVSTDRDVQDWEVQAPS
ncbi:hypothetical protein PVAP13_9NG091100 [Panicum virgatum]|uniref:Uncharacterized protein n=1 Tax=Panicum virgatum TaxID=38727 RepID=A0A8T0MJ89_PANVG|nr:hypothetical protein PVAP13_9NG091100 [Panicum virgatum]